MTYRDATARLFSLEHWGIKLGLENISQLCHLLGDPQERYLSVHVAGTNGKGSTTAYLDSILRAGGFRVGRYTSPHIRDFRERIHVDGRPIPRVWVARFVERHWRYLRDRHITFFEATTALAFEAFAHARVDIAVVEVGLGGRFDATNIIPSSLAIITRIARDHEHILGHTPGKIAFEKAGIIKPGVPVLTGPLCSEADLRIRTIAARRRAPIWTAAEILRHPRGQLVLPRRGEHWRTSLAGSHQVTNLAVALAGVSLLGAQGVAVPRSAMRRGTARVNWPGRFHVAGERPTIVFDAAHNPDGMRATVATWRQKLAGCSPVCVFTTRADKAYGEMVSIMSPLARHWVGCPLPDGPGVGRAEMENLARRHHLAFTWADSARGALRLARRLAGTSGHVLVVGSHYLLGAVVPAGLIGGSVLDRRNQTAVARADILRAAQAHGPVF